MARLSREADAIRIIEGELAGIAPSVLVGIGDDAAVLASGGKLVCSVDDSLEGVHFRRDWASLRAIARRAVHAAASDLAAMGASPLAALVSLELSPSIDSGALRQIARGQADASRELALPVVGGNLTAGKQLRFTTTVLGRARRPWLRSGARAGDEIWLLGSVGAAGSGLWVLEQGGVAAMPRTLRRAARSCVRAWAQPRALIGEALKLSSGAVHAAIDLSDGLAIDAARMAVASGVTLVIEQAALDTAIGAAVRAVCVRRQLAPIEAALWGGEDYALLLTGPARRRPEGVARLGHVIAGRGQAVIQRCDKRRVVLDGGFDHLRRNDQRGG